VYVPRQVPALVLASMARGRSALHTTRGQMVPPATHRTILVVDVEKFGDQSRTDSERVTIHGGLRELLQDACQGAGIDWDLCYCEDRGDGTMVLAPPSIPKAQFSDLLPGRLACAPV
jgi:hypothetical protein